MRVIWCQLAASFLETRMSNNKLSQSNAFPDDRSPANNHANSTHVYEAARTDRSTVLLYAGLSLGGFICALLILAAYIWKAALFVSLGLSGNLYYVALLPLGVAAAAFLFGAMRSYSSYRGQHFGGVLELGGPVVAFFLVPLLGFWLLPSSDFTFTIFVHGAQGRKDLLVHNQGSMLLDLGGFSREESIGANGGATFAGISSRFKGQAVPVGLKAEGFELKTANNQVTLSGESTYRQILRSAGLFSGYARDDDDEAISRVTVTVLGLSTQTDSAGRFALSVPGDQLKPDLLLSATANGFQRWEQPAVANGNDITIRMHRRGSNGK